MTDQTWDTPAVHAMFVIFAILCVLVPASYHAPAQGGAVPVIAVTFGLLSATFWLLSAAVPLFHRPARSWQVLPFGFNAIAASATAGAIIATLP